jgi:signal recognition particle receptor subunit beta
VFYGPGLEGKTTSLQYIHNASKPELRGNMVSLATDTDRTLYFDFLPVELLKLKNLSVRLQLFTVPGQVYYTATRKLVLAGADGIVFVADSQVARLEANQESLEDLNTNLAEHGRALSQVPHAFQWNKRDLGEIASLDELERRLNLFGAPSTATVATRGDGVFAGLEQITRAAINAYKAELPQGKRARVPIFLDAEEVGLADAIRELADSQREKTPSSPSQTMQAARPASAGARALEATLSSNRAPSSPTPASSGRARDSSPGAIPPPAAPPAENAGRSPIPPAARSPVPPAVAPSAAAASAALAERKAAEPVKMTDRPSSEPAPSSGSRDVEPLTKPPPTVAPGMFGSFSLAELWPEKEREGVRRAETLLGARDAASAVLACDVLFTRILAEASLVLGPSDKAREPAILALLLGIEGPRYLSFRAVARAARQQRDVGVRDALECYRVTLDARRALDRLPR